MSNEMRATQSANDYIGYTVADMVIENAKLYAALQASTEILRRYRLYFVDQGCNIEGLNNQIAANEAALGKVNNDRL